MTGTGGYTQGMANHETLFRNAIERDLPVTAHVQLFSGEHRIRLGPVANLTSTHVTIFDIGKGFRTTPIPMVISASILEPHTSWFARLFTALRGLLFGDSE